MRPEQTPPRTQRIDEAAEALVDFEYIGPCWGGVAKLRCWGEKELNVYLKPVDEDITPRQIEVLRAVLQYPTDLRSTFETALFAFYKADIEGSYMAYDPVAQKHIPDSGPPVLAQSQEVWSLIDDPELRIDWLFRTPTAVEFQLMFNCEWDPEHGLGVRYQDWKPVSVGCWEF